LQNYKNFSIYSKLYPIIYTIRPKFPRFFNFWNSERHQSSLGNGRVMTKVNTVNQKALFVFVIVDNMFFSAQSRE